MASSFPFASRGYDFQEYVACKNWIGGEWQSAHSGETQPVQNPRHERTLGTVAWSGAADVDAAVAAASAALPGWKATPLKERCQVLYRVKLLMEERLDELAWLLSHENGKTIAQARGSVLKGIECVEFGTSLPNLAQGEQLDVSRGINCEVSMPTGSLCSERNAIGSAIASDAGYRRSTPSQAAQAARHRRTEAWRSGSPCRRRAPHCQTGSRPRGSSGYRPSSALRRRRRSD